jgi:transposase
MKSANIHGQLCKVYAEHAMSDSMVRRWVRHFNEGRKNAHDDLRSGRSSVVNEDLVRVVEEKIQENRRFTFSSFSLYFAQILRSLFHEIAYYKLRFWKLCSRWVPMMLTDEHKMKQATWHA